MSIGVKGEGGSVKMLAPRHDQLAAAPQQSQFLGRWWEMRMQVERAKVTSAGSVQFHMEKMTRIDFLLKFGWVSNSTKGK